MQEKNNLFSDVSEKLKKLISDTGNNTNSFAKKLGYERSQAIYDILNGKSQPSFDFFKRLKQSEYSDLSIDDTFFNSELIVKDPAGQYKNSKLIPVIPYNVIAGNNHMPVSVVGSDIDQYISIPFLQEKADFAFKLQGDSMSPKYNDGSYILCKEIELSDLRYDNVYLICVEHSPMLKRILPESTDAILCRSDNPAHRDFTIPKKNITYIAKVIASICI
jgi:phage repressor protein C with HTH and peptisase S24 domain